MLITELNSALKKAMLEKDETGLFKKDEKKILDILNQFTENNAIPNIDFNGHSIIYLAVSLFPDSILLKLLELGVDANCTISVGELKTTPLHVAIHHKSIKKVQHLLKFNANINAQDSNGDTALHLSLNFHELKLAKIFLEQGIDPTIRNKADKIASDLNTTDKVQELFKEIEDNQAAKGQIFSLSLKYPNDSVKANLNTLLEGSIEQFVKENKLDYVNRITAANEGTYILKFTGKSNPSKVKGAITACEILLKQQCKNIYGVDYIELLPTGNSALDKSYEDHNVQLGGDIPEYDPTDVILN